MGVGPLARWKQAELPALAQRLRWAAGVAVVAALVAALAARPARTRRRALGLLMAFWIVASIATDLATRLRPHGGVRPASRTARARCRARWSA